MHGTQGHAIGQLTLRKLRLKKGALDKFRLPVDVIEGALHSFYVHDIRPHQDDASN